MMSLKHILYLLHVSVLVATIASNLPEKSSLSIRRFSSANFKKVSACTPRIIGVNARVDIESSSKEKKITRDVFHSLMPMRHTQTQQSRECNPK